MCRAETREGYAVWLSWAAESKGWQNSQKNKYFKRKNLIFCTQQILNY
jgi:hypothetical protein